MALVDIHEEVFKLLLEEREHNSKLKFRPRKTNRSNRLRDGYWFLGNDAYLSIPFWEGMNWKTRSPNISMVVDYEGSAWLQVNTSDSDEKTKFVKKYLVHSLGLKKVQDKDYKYMKGYPNAKDYKDVLKRFFHEDYHIIDDSIKNQFHKQQFENLPFNIIDDEVFFGDLDIIRKFREESLRQDKKWSKVKPTKIISFRIQNYGPIMDCCLEEIPFTNQWVFITGENGVGKSSILKALVSTLGHRFVSAYESNSVNQFNTEITLAGENEETISVRREANNGTNRRKPFSIGLAAYGPVRLSPIHGGLSSSARKVAHRKSGIFNSLFSNQGHLLELENELMLWDKDGEHGFSEMRRKYIKELLEEAMPNVGRVTLSHEINDIKTTLFEEIDSNGEWFPPVTIDKLSSGYLSIVAMMSDMLMRLFKQQPECVDFASLQGVVVIDEIDIHLHPKFQKHLVEQLTEAFPNVQFVVSTHSPIPLLGAPKESVFLKIERTKNEGVIIKRLEKLENEFQYLLPNTLLTSDIFDFEISKGQSEEQFMNTRLEDNYDEIEKNKKIAESLENVDKDIFPDDLFDKED